MLRLPQPETPAVVPTPERRAFVVFLMFNDSYLPGALTAAYGLHLQHSESRRVCVVTPEITSKARRMLRELFHEVVEISPIAAPSMPGTDQGQVRTGSARVKSAALTRFGALRLGLDGDLGCWYERIIVIDADLFPVRDFETLWELPPPAGIINERRHHMAEIDTGGSLVVPPDSLVTGTTVWHETYGSTCPHGSPIPRELTDRVAEDETNYGVNASLVAMAPSMSTYSNLMEWVARPDICKMVNEKWPWIDQQAFTLYWSGRWTSVDVSFSTLYGYPSLDLARGLHFAGIKPWSWRKKGFERRLQRFPDYGLWASIFCRMLIEFPSLRGHKGLANIDRAIGSALR